MKRTLMGLAQGVACCALLHAMVGTAFAQQAAAPATPAAGATATDDQGLEEIVVTGIKRSLQVATEIKRNSVNVVDSIASEDLGKMPDQNVAESLQRITGVAIDRNRGDGQFISVRGLGPQFNTVTLNGRTLATENVGREFSFDVLPSELISGADVYKSPSANINGASIGATVNIRTVRPLEQKQDLVVAGSARALYGELADSTNPSLSGVVSWHNPESTFGVALVASYEKRDSRDDEFDIGAGHVKRGNVDPTDYWYGRTAPSVGSFTGVDMPSNLSPFFYETSRKRTGLNGTVQYQPNDNLTFTLDGFYTKMDQIDQSQGLAYDFSSGTLVDQVVKNGSAVYQKIVGGTVDEIVTYTPRLTETYLVGLNTAWHKDAFKLVFDASTSQATRNGKEDSIFSTIRRRDMTMTFDRRNGNPIYDYNFYSPTISNVATDVNNVGAHYNLWGGTDYKDEVNEAKLDGTWDPGGGISISAGASHQERTKTADAISQPGSVACAYCGGAVLLPSSLFTPTTMDFFSKYKSDNIIRNWITYDPKAMVNYLMSRPEGIYTRPVADPAASSRVKEKVNLGYLMFDLKTEIGGLPLSVNTGVRIEDTTYTSAGAAQTVLSAKPNGLGQNLIVLSDVQPISFSGHYTDILPSLNVKLDLTNDLVARFATSRVMTRPTLSDLSPAQTILSNPGNEQITKGNPDLNPFRASQAEFGLEWYFQPLSMLSAAVFYKNIDSFVAQATTPQKVDQVVFQVTQPTNGKGATVKGLEVGYRQVFDMLPGPFDGLGGQASFTYVESDAKYANVVSGASYGLQGLSKYSYSLVAFYEKHGIQARLAYTWRDRFLQVASGRNGDPEYFDAYGQLDASLSYDLTENISLTLEGLNLTDENEFIYSTTPDRTKEYRTTGRRYAAGVRVKF
ncbi:TonB-dependent receptor [Azospirillum sp. B4]|uniref:TonB-dependent receptor n=1 Tax=Azospirillum sp. B4 TaxID=95605 RepID=UPI000347EF1E|nr:TonB-dependent receptor [Azospirillum sp. B4]